MLFQNKDVLLWEALFILPSRISTALLPGITQEEQISPGYGDRPSPSHPQQVRCCFCHKPAALSLHLDSLCAIRGTSPIWFLNRRSLAVSPPPLPFMPAPAQCLFPKRFYKQTRMGNNSVSMYWLKLRTSALSLKCIQITVTHSRHITKV